MSQYLLLRIQSLQEELENLKKLVDQNPRKKTHIKGLWKGFDINENDFETAEKAIFKNTSEWEL
jgi:hypothetical protein